MRKIISSLVLFLIVLSSKGQNVGIGTNNPHPSAALDITDSTKGILIPRMTISQRNNIQNPAEGLMVYQTDSAKGFWYFENSKWQQFYNACYINDSINSNNNFFTSNKNANSTSNDSITLKYDNEVWEISLNHNNSCCSPDGTARSITISFLMDNLSAFPSNSFFIVSTISQISSNTAFTATAGGWNKGALVIGRLFWDRPAGTKVKIRTTTSCPDCTTFPMTSWTLRILR